MVERCVKRFFFVVMLLCVFIMGASAQDASWIELKGNHFVILYRTSDHDFASHVLRESEKYYNFIAEQIGYSRYGDYWTWEDRVKIFIYPDQGTFVRETGQPLWARGGAIRDTSFFQSRAIITYRQEEDFMRGVLPHEISHLILHDFVGGQRTIPLWFDEGVAQLQEEGKKEFADRIMRQIAKIGQTIPFDIMAHYNVRYAQEAQNVAIFYAQSVSVVDYMIRSYGYEKIRQLLSYMRDGVSFEEALRRAYSSTIPSMETLEKNWRRYVQEY